MSRKRFTTEQIVHKLRQAEVEIAKGQLVLQAQGVDVAARWTVRRDGHNLGRA